MPCPLFFLPWELRCFSFFDFLCTVSASPLTSVGGRRRRRGTFIHTYRAYRVEGGGHLTSKSSFFFFFLLIRLRFVAVRSANKEKERESNIAAMTAEVGKGASALGMKQEHTLFHDLRRKLARREGGHTPI